MKRRRPGTQFTPRIPSEVIERDRAEINLRKRHGPPVHGRFRFAVHFLDKNAHPLISRAMSIHGTSFFPSGLDFHPFFAGLDCVIRIDTLHHKIRMAIEIFVLDKNSGMRREAGCEHVRQNTRHDRRPQYVVQSLETFRNQMFVDIMEEVIDILQR